MSANSNSNQNTPSDQRVDARYSTFNDVRGDQEHRHLVQAIDPQYLTSNNIAGNQINTYYIFVCDGRAVLVALGLGIAGIAGLRLFHAIRA